MSPVEIKEIEDSWDTIFANEANGTYLSKYKIGNYKPLDLGAEGIVNMQIVAFDKDQKADGSGTAPISWLSKELLKTSKRMNPALEIIYDFRDAKGWPEGTTSMTGAGIARWGSKNAYTDNVHAIGKMEFTASRDTELNIQARTYTSQSGDKLTCIVDGEVLCSDYSSSTYIEKTIELTKNQKVSVHVDYLNTSTELRNYGEICMKGAGKCVCTAEDSRERYGIGIEGTGAVGGWEKSEMRKYFQEIIKPLIPGNVRLHIVPVNKSHSAYSTELRSVSQTTVDDVWIPDFVEVHSDYIKGGIYRRLFVDNASRVKKKVGEESAYIWALRNSSSSNRIYCVSRNGEMHNISEAENERAIALGFCT